MKIGEQLVGTRAPAREVRDPSAATFPVRYQSPGHPLIANWDAQRALTYGYYANTFVYRCVQCIAQDIGALPFRMGADPERPHDYDTKHALARLLGPPPGGPNPETSGRQLLAWTVAQYLVTGRFGWEKELGTNGLPIAFWPLPAPYLRPVPTEGGARYFRAFEFGRPGEERRLTADQTFYHWRPRGDDWRQPESVLDAARHDVSVAVMQDRYDYAFLRNDARPAALVVYEGFATDDEDTAFKRQYRGEYGGPDNAGKTMFVEADGGDKGVAGAIDIKALGLTQKDAQFVARYDAKLRAICVAFGVPLTRLGDASGRTFANAGEEFHVYWVGLLGLIAELQDAINMKLAPAFGAHVGWFDLSKVEALKNKVDPVTAQVGAPSMVQAQLMTIDEARADYGLPPLPGGKGDRLMTVEEIQALRGVEQSAPPARTRTPEPLALPAPGPTHPPTPAAAPSRDARGGEVPGPTIDHRIAERRAVAVITTETQVNALEHTWERAFVRLFAAQEAQTVARLNGKRGRQALRDTRDADPDAIFDRTFWTATTAEEARALYESVFVAGAGRVTDQFGITFDLEAPYVDVFISARSKQLAGQVTDTTYEAVKGALAEGAEAGETVPQIAARVREVFAQASDTRAVTIARTEVISAYNGAATTVAAQAPRDVVAAQEWIATNDARTRPAHGAADGQTVTVGTPFNVGGHLMAYPGDPNGGAHNTVNCRCTVAFLTPDEMDARCWRVEKRTALAILGLVRAGETFDEHELRRALREVRAA